MSEYEIPEAAATGATARRSPVVSGGLGPVGRPPRRPRYPCLRGAGPQLESLPELLELLPPDFSYHVCSYEPLPGGFAATLRVNFGSERGARDWLAAFQQSSLTTFRSRRTFPRPGPRLLYKAWFRCQRNVPGAAAGVDGTDSRHTACPAALAVSVCSPSVTRRADPHLPTSPGCVRLRHVHNHPVRCAADLRFRGVSVAARGALETLLARGYAPAAARRALQHQLQLQLGERYPLAAADRAVLPTLKDVCRIYYQLYGTPAQRRATAAAAVQNSVTLEREAVEDEVTGRDGDPDDPGMESGNRGRFERSDSGVAGLGLDSENPAAARLELEFVDADGFMFDSANAGSEYPVLERVNPDGLVLESTSQERMLLEPAGTDCAAFQSGERDRLAAGRSEPGNQTAERSERAELLLGSAADATLELELVHPDDLTVGVTDHREQILESADPTEAAPETGASQTAADAVDPLPSLESLLAGSSVPDPDATAARLERLVTEYSAAMARGGGAAAFRRLDGCGFAAALTTPLMWRAHRQLPQSGELVFVDSPGRSERHGCCLWLLVCASEAGAMPLGLLLASSDSGGSLRAALELWQRTLPMEAFAGRGADGPQVMITDDGAGQRAAVAAQFPAALTVLCAFRLLQSVWRWLWQVRGRVSSADRSRLLLLARRLLRAGSVSQLERRFREAAADSAMARHPDFLKQFSSIYRHRHLWAVWYGEEEPSDADTGGGGGGAAQTASLFDLAASLLRDRLLFMAAEYGPAEAFDFWSRRGDPYFVQRIGRGLSGGGSLASQPRYVPPQPGAELRTRRSGPHEHEVTEAGAAFQVDLELGCCTCRLGRTGAPCAHQSAAARLERRPPPAPVAAESAARLRRLAARLPLLDPGPAPLPAGWLQAVTAAAGLPRLELIVSAESAPHSRPPAAEQHDDSVEQDAEGLFTGGDAAMQLEGGDVHNMDRPERLQDTADIKNSAGSEGYSANGEVGHSLDIVGLSADGAGLSADGAGLSADNADGSSGVAAPVDPAEEAMSAAIVALQEVTADLTGRLAAEPERYVPLVQDLVNRYWRLEGADGLRAMSDRLTGLLPETAAEQAEEW